jgi:hypothetical protein
MVRIELTTYGLRNRCSTTELHWPPVTGADCEFPEGFPKSAASGTPIAKPSCPRFVKTNIPRLRFVAPARDSCGEGLRVRRPVGTLPLAMKLAAC